MEEEIKDCPRCYENDLKPIYIGNDEKGWDNTGEYECFSCGYYQDKE